MQTANDVKIKFFSPLPDEARQIRTEVFVKEQGFTNEFDDIDDTAHHLVLYDENDTAIGTARMFLSDNNNSDVYTLGRLAVLKPYRKRHLGDIMLAALENKARQLGGTKVELSAQCRVRIFYEKYGYTASGETYFDEYCPHIHMEKILLKEEV